MIVDHRRKVSKSGIAVRKQQNPQLSGLFLPQKTSLKLLGKAELSLQTAHIGATRNITPGALLLVPPPPPPHTVWEHLPKCYPPS